MEGARHMQIKHDADGMQERTRQERGFLDIESRLPNLSHLLLGPISPSTVPSKLRDLLSLLGTRNPLPRQVAADDTVWLFDNTAYRNPQDGHWEAEFVAAAFAQRPSAVLADILSTVAKELGLNPNDENHKRVYPTMQQRILPFLQDIKPGTVIKVTENGNKMSLGPGGINGISSEVKKLKGKKRAGVLNTQASVPKGANGVLQMKTFYAEPEGWGVISDIDDTIKKTMTSSPVGILQTTFVDTPKPTKGMAALYKYMQKLVKDTAPWFYLSASPYNLYPFLKDFVGREYPHGSIILRDSSFMSVAGLLSQLTEGTEEYKTDRMKKIHEWLPKRKMICIGDSTQTDPESYGEMYRAFPGWVRLILIRKVKDIAAIGLQEKNEAQRFEKAFKGVPRQDWHVFDEERPEECKAILARTVALD